ncbi:MAG: biotin/lipoyl-containing protein [Gemmatimonadota bacterium]
MKYYATVNGEPREVEVDADGIRLDGTPIEAELVGLPGEGQYHLRIGDQGYWLVATPSEGSWVMDFGGCRLVVGVEDERARSVRQLTGQGSTATSARDLRAPMPGLVLRVLVGPGEEVGAGTSLVVIEAMKMENELKAEVAGVVESVAVREGDAVNRGALLVTFRQAEGEGAVKPDRRRP